MRQARIIALAFAVAAAALSSACTAEGSGRAPGAERAASTAPDLDLGREPRNGSAYRRP